MQLVNVPGIVSKPPDTKDKQIEDTSTPLSFVSSSFNIAAETCDFKVSIFHHRSVAYPGTDTRFIGAIFNHVSHSLEQLVEIFVSTSSQVFASPCLSISWQISKERDVILIIFGSGSQQRDGASDFKDLAQHIIPDAVFFRSVCIIVKKIPKKSEAVPVHADPITQSKGCIQSISLQVRPNVEKGISGITFAGEISDYAISLQVKHGIIGPHGHSAQSLACGLSFVLPRLEQVSMFHKPNIHIPYNSHPMVRTLW